MDNIILSLGMDDSSIRIDALSILIYISRDTHYKQQLADNDKLTAALVTFKQSSQVQTRLEHSGSDKEKACVEEIFSNVKKYFKINLNQQSYNGVQFDLYNQKRTENKYYRYDVHDLSLCKVDYRNRGSNRLSKDPEHNTWH